MNVLAIADINNKGGDIQHAASLQNGNALDVLIYTSLFTDALAKPEQVSNGDSDRRGHWADTYQDRSRGSLLWTVRREKITTPVQNEIRGICLTALAWLVDTGRLLSMNVRVEKIGKDRDGILVTGILPSGANYSYEVPLNAV
jgi:phage gp46-like protein